MDYSVESGSHVPGWMPFQRCADAAGGGRAGQDGAEAAMSAAGIHCGIHCVVNYFYAAV
jgi:hypothetical protein